MDDIFVGDILCSLLTNFRSTKPSTELENFVMDLVQYVSSVSLRKPTPPRQFEFPSSC